jgi:hypothetical protein
MSSSYLRQFVYAVIVFCLFLASRTIAVRAETADVQNATVAVPAGDAAHQGAPTGQNRPRISIDVPEYDAGTIREGEDIFYAFHVSNRGTDLLEIFKVKPG